MKSVDLPKLQAAKVSIKKAGFFTDQDFSIFCGLNKNYIRNRINFDIRTDKQKKNNETVGIERGKDLPDYICEMADDAASFHIMSKGRLHLLTDSEPKKITIKEFYKELELINCSQEELVNLGWRQRKEVPKWGPRFVELKKLLMLNRSYEEYSPATLFDNIAVCGLSLNRFSELIGYSQSNLISRPILEHIFNLSGLMKELFIINGGEIDFEQIIWGEKAKYLKDKANKYKLKFTNEELDALLDVLSYDKESFAKFCGSTVRHITWSEEPKAWSIAYLRLLMEKKRIS